MFTVSQKNRTLFEGFGWTFFVFVYFCLSMTVSAAQINSPFAQNTTERVAPPISDIIQISKSKVMQKTSGATVLLRQIESDFEKNTHTEYQAIALHGGVAASEYTQIRVPFNTFYEEISLDLAGVFKKDGSYLEIQPEAIQIQSKTQNKFYQDEKELVFSIPSVLKGNVIEFQFTLKKIKEKIPGHRSQVFLYHWWQRNDSQAGLRVDPVLETNIELRVAQEVPLNFTEIEAGKSLEIHHSKPTQHHKIRHYRFKVKDLEARNFQSGMAPMAFSEQAFSATTLKDWSEIDAWSYDLIKDKIIWYNNRRGGRRSACWFGELHSRRGIGAFHK